MKNKPDDWEKNRSHAQHLTPAEIEIIRQRKEKQETPRTIARDLKCSTRVVYRYFAQFEGRLQGRHQVKKRSEVRKPKAAHHQFRPTEPPRPRLTPAEQKASRHYHSNFEL